MLAIRISERAATHPQLLLKIKSLSLTQDLRSPPQLVASPGSDLHAVGAVDVLLSAFLARLGDSISGTCRVERVNFCLTSL